MTRLTVLVQREYACTKCKQCGFVYAPGQAEDVSLHWTYHRQATQGISFQVTCHVLSKEASKNMLMSSEPQPLCNMSSKCAL